MRPKRTDDKYWKGTRDFNHIQYETDLEDYIIDLENEAQQLRKHAVMRNVYAVYPDGERLDIGKNRLSAIFRYKDHAEEFAKSKWGPYYIIEKMSSEHFA